MKLSDVDQTLLLTTLAKMGPTFRTRELSARGEMIAGHACSNDRNYHAIIGSYLSKNVAQVELIDNPGGPKGARWRNLLHAGSGTSTSASTAPARPIVRARSASAPVDLGPQYAKDDPFRARMRLHQSWYRAHVLKVPCGTGPSPSSTSRYGNMLTPADGAAGKNFLTPAIHAQAMLRLALGSGAVEPFRLLHNMLSSQPMCFNLFAPLADDLELATRLVRAIWGPHIARVTRVELEWAPTPKHEYLDDNTAFDAFIEYQLTNGAYGFIGIETKLTEPFSQTHHDKASYRRWMTPDSPWRTDIDGIDRIEHNQLWRDHLLAWALLRHPSSRYAEGTFCVLYHPEDTRCATVIEGYRALLHTPDSLRPLTLDVLVAAWKPHVGAGSWLEAFAVRYLDLHRSQPAPAPQPSIRRATGNAVRPGHLRALEQLEATGAYARTRTLYREALGGVDVFLRPTDAGFTVLSLDADHCASMIGVGSRDTNEHTVRTLPPDPTQVRRAVLGYHAKRTSLRRPSTEETYALRLIASALDGGLALGPVYFVTQEWRLPSGSKLDLLCADPRTRRLVVVELKDSEPAAHRADPTKGGNAWEQARRYAAELHEHRHELYPFFERLARALAHHHDGPAEMRTLTLDLDQPPRALVSWPGGGFR